MWCLYLQHNSDYTPFFELAMCFSNGEESPPGLFLQSFVPAVVMMNYMKQNYLQIESLLFM